MLATEHGNKMITNKHGTLIHGTHIGFECPYCKKENLVSIQRALEEPYFCKCGNEVEIFIGCKVSRLR